LNGCQALLRYLGGQVTKQVSKHTLQAAATAPQLLNESFNDRYVLKIEELEDGEF
jgi:hypothetical protein